MNASPIPLTAPPPWRVAHFETLDSTSEEARRRALAGDPGRLWIVAAEQSEGRGRRGRTWVSPKGNLYASALLIIVFVFAPSPLTNAAMAAAQSLF